MCYGELFGDGIVGCRLMLINIDRVDNDYAFSDIDICKNIYLKNISQNYVDVTNAV